jgi:hypothetical protein
MTIEAAFGFMMIAAFIWFLCQLPGRKKQKEEDPHGSNPFALRSAMMSSEAFCQRGPATTGTPRV